MLYQNYTYILPNFFTPDEVSKIHGVADSINAEESKTGVFRDKDPDAPITNHDNPTVRQSTNKWIEHNLVPSHLFDKVNEGFTIAKTNSGWNYDLNYMEAFQYTIYTHRPTQFSDGDFYTWHCDQGVETYPNGNHRKLSATIQLTDPDEYEGGHFQWLEWENAFNTLRNGSMLNSHDLIHTAPFSAKGLGSMIIFPSWLHHQVTPVTRGERRSLVVWNCGYPYK